MAVMSAKKAAVLLFLAAIFAFSLSAQTYSVRRTNNPFTYQIPNPGIIADITDSDTSGYNGTSELAGSGSCTYDPLSNTGVVQVRRFSLAAPPPGCTQNGGAPGVCPYNIYTIVDSAVFP